MRPQRLIKIRSTRRMSRRNSFSRVLNPLFYASWLLPSLTCGVVMAQPQTALAQGVADSGEGATIAYPLPNNTLTGSTKLLFRDIPDGGYISIYVDLTPTSKTESFRTATTQTSYQLDAGALTDGKHTLTIVSFSASGRQVGTRSVTFNVVNTGSAGVSEDSVTLVNWTKQDVMSGKVQRFRVFAVSDATITGGESTAGGGPGGFSGGGPSGGGPGASGGAAETAPKLTAAPLDHQVDILVRRVVRDAGMIDGSANIRMAVAAAFDRKRLGSSGGGGASGGPGGGPSGGAATADSDLYPVGYKGKPYWDPQWHRGLESSQAYTKTIKPNGEEINAIKKPATLPLGDILPTFPSYAVQKGATWNSDMTFVGELTTRAPQRLTSVPMSLTAFENVATPAGFERRCARVEISQFSLPDNIAKSICSNLQTEAGSSGASGGPGGSSSAPTGAGGPGGAGAASNTPPKMINYRATLSRVIWFDIAAHQLVRSEDTVDAFYEEQKAQATSGAPSFGGGFAPPGFPGGAGFPGGPSVPAAPAVPKTVTYNMRVVKFLDDRLPNPTGKWTGGMGTAHTIDNVRDPSIAKANGADVNNR